MVVMTPQIEVGSALTEQQAREIFSRGEETVVFALLQLAQQLAVASGVAAAGGDLVRLVRADSSGSVGLGGAARGRTTEATVPGWRVDGKSHWLWCFANVNRHHQWSSDHHQ